MNPEEAIERYCRSDSPAQRLAYAGVSTQNMLLYSITLCPYPRVLEFCCLYQPLVVVDLSFDVLLSAHYQTGWRHVVGGAWPKSRAVIYLIIQRPANAICISYGSNNGINTHFLLFTEHRDCFPPHMSRMAASYPYVRCYSYPSCPPLITPKDPKFDCNCMKDIALPPVRPSLPSVKPNYP